MEWDTAILSGLFTGIGVILAQKLVKWLETHPIIARFTSKFNKVSRGEESLHDLMQKQRDLGKKIEDKISGVKKHRPRF
jgi:uncharacterized membrane protein YhiD involved in acid resistance